MDSPLGHHRAFVVGLPITQNTEAMTTAVSGQTRGYRESRRSGGMCERRKPQAAAVSVDFLSGCEGERFGLTALCPAPGVLQGAAGVRQLWQGGLVATGALLRPPDLQPVLLPAQLQEVRPPQRRAALQMPQGTS